MLSYTGNHSRQAGTSLIEVMVTLAILSFSLLGIAGLQSKIGTAEMESYQRAQALVALSQMTERMSSNLANAPLYVTGLATPLGTGDTQPANCGGLTGVALDQCDWSNTLKGAGETSGGGANVGAMIGGRGCIEQIQVANFALGNCAAGIYRVSVVWQGLTATAVPAIACGANLYGAETNRRLISATVSQPTTSCY